MRSSIAAMDLDTYSVRQAIKCLAPKGVNGFRPITQLDPYDCLVATALVFELGYDLENEHADRTYVHSYRFDPDLRTGRLYSAETNYQSFEERSISLAEGGDHGWVVMTDIADFFPRLYLHPLENMLRRSVAESWTTVADGSGQACSRSSLRAGIRTSPTAFLFGTGRHQIACKNRHY